MSGLETKIPPPLVALCTATLMWLTTRATPSLTFMLPAHGTLALCVAVMGVATSIMGVAEFRRTGTTVNPLTPEKASSLVASGIYRRTRNPMYLGMLLALLAWGLFLSNVLAFAFLPAFVLYMNRFQIRPEEAALMVKFGEQFVAYKSSVRRWL